MINLNVLTRNLKIKFILIISYGAVSYKHIRDKETKPKLGCRPVS